MKITVEGRFLDDDAVYVPVQIVSKINGVLVTEQGTLCIYNNPALGQKLVVREANFPVAEIEPKTAEIEILEKDANR